MAPLGIITAFISAIRVAGPEWLKSLVGRGRENFATIEIEILSSVSKDVCELWDGRAIVKLAAEAPIMIVHNPQHENDFSPESFITLDPATQSSGYRLQEVDKYGRSGTWLLPDTIHELTPQLVHTMHKASSTSKTCRLTSQSTVMTAVLDGNSGWVPLSLLGFRLQS